MSEKSEELFKIVTAYRFIAMLLALMVALMGHYGVAIDPEVAKMINTFLVSFIGVNSGGKWIDKIALAIKDTNSNSFNGEV
jgi:hypothetical protein